MEAKKLNIPGGVVERSPLLNIDNITKVMS